MSVTDYTTKTPEMQIGPTALGMVRVYVVSERAQIPLDFSPEEAEALAERLQAVAAEARRRQTRAVSPRRLNAV